MRRSRSGIAYDPDKARFPRHRNTERDDEIRERVLAGEYQVEAARAFDISRERVRQIITSDPERFRVIQAAYERARVGVEGCRDRCS